MIDLVLNRNYQLKKTFGDVAETQTKLSNIRYVYPIFVLVAEKHLGITSHHEKTRYKHKCAFFIISADNSVAMYL